MRKCQAKLLSFWMPIPLPVSWRLLQTKHALYRRNKQKKRERLNWIQLLCIWRQTTKVSKREISSEVVIILLPSTQNLCETLAQRFVHFDSKDDLKFAHWAMCWVKTVMSNWTHINCCFDNKWVKNKRYKQIIISWCKNYHLQFMFTQRAIWMQL